VPLPTHITFVAVLAVGLFATTGCSREPPAVAWESQLEGSIGRRPDCGLRGAAQEVNDTPDVVTPVYALLSYSDTSPSAGESLPAAPQNAGQPTPSYYGALLHLPNEAVFWRNSGHETRHR
jgi:hypothetical protein